MDLPNTVRRVLRPRANRNAYCEPHVVPLPGPTAEQTKPAARAEMVLIKPLAKLQQPANDNAVAKMESDLRLEPWSSGRYYAVIMYDLFGILESLRPIAIENFGSVATNLAFKGKRFCC